MTLHTAVLPETEDERAFYRVCVRGELNPFAPRDTCGIRITELAWCTREHGHADRCVASTDTTVVVVGK